MNLGPSAAHASGMRGEPRTRSERRRTAVRAATAVGALAALITSSSCQRDEHAVQVATEHTCAGALAIESMYLFGNSLPPKTIALTFDDGPGVRTAELSTYLNAHNIRSAFFVNGKNLTAGTAILAQLVADGHMIGNHTQTHASLTGTATATPRLSPAAIVSEIDQTDALIEPFLFGRYLFRPPYGDWDAQAAADINASPMSKYVASIGWDIGNNMGPQQAADWDCWRAATDNLVLTPTQCGDLYVSEIERVDHGIVLLHDPYFINDDPAQGGTVDMIKYIVPILKTKGFTFVRVDQVPDIASRLPPAPPSSSDAGADAAAEASVSVRDASVSNAEAAPSEAGTTRNKGLDESAHSGDPCARSVAPRVSP